MFPKVCDDGVMTKRLTTYGKNYDIEKWREILASLTPFTTGGSLRGDTYLDGTGRLDQDTARHLRTRDVADLIDFVVYSYATPIAWHDTEAGWIIPDEQYSPTTSKQQGKIRYALLNNYTTV